MSRSIAYTSSPLLASRTPVWRSKLIVAGQYKPGEILPREELLSAQLQVSRTALPSLTSRSKPGIPRSSAISSISSSGCTRAMPCGLKTLSCRVRLKSSRAW